MGVHEAWANDRDAVLDQGGKVVEALNERAALPSGPLPTEETAGGGGRQPPGDLRRGAGRVRRRAEVPAVDGAGVPASRTHRPQARAMADRTLESMARGGLYDQLAGGFARYSVDDAWIVPHFEKMLYDNALLLRVYAHWWRDTGSPLAKRIALETASWMIAELRTPKAGSPRRSTPTARARRGVSTSGRPTSCRRSSARTTPRGRRSSSRSPARSNTAPRSCSSSTTPTTRSATSRSGPACRTARGAAGPARPRRQGGRGVERAGHRRPGRDRARCSIVRRWSRRRRRPRSCSTPSTSATAACCAPPATAARGPTPGCSRTTPTSPRGS